MNEKGLFKYTPVTHCPLTSSFNTYSIRAMSNPSANSPPECTETSQFRLRTVATRRNEGDESKLDYQARVLDGSRFTSVTVDGELRNSALPAYHLDLHDLLREGKITVDQCLEMYSTYMDVNARKLSSVSTVIDVNGERNRYQAESIILEPFKTSHIKGSRVGYVAHSVACCVIGIFFSFFMSYYSGYKN
ncbi:hypothetical protein BDQ17DRAFT_1412224, partial [Cyathus striatus]